MQRNRLQSLVVHTLDEMKAQNITVLDVHGVSDVTDIMVIASGTSNRQVKSMASAVFEKAKEHKYRPLGMEGEDAGEWVLVDLGDVVVHLMLPQVRDFYNLEKLWGDVAQAHKAEGAAAAKKSIKKTSPQVASKTTKKSAAAGPAARKRPVTSVKKSVKPKPKVRPTVAKSKPVTAKTAKPKTAKPVSRKPVASKRKRSSGD